MGGDRKDFRTLSSDVGEKVSREGLLIGRLYRDAYGRKPNAIW